VQEVVVVTSLHRQDLPIVAWCSSRHLRVYCGAEEDVLDRFYQAARLTGAHVCVRITADCPLMDPAVIDQVVAELDDPKVDYANNCEHETWPDGLDVEAFRFAALKKAWEAARLPSEREHVTPYIRKHRELFELRVVDHTPSLGGMRWTLDEPADLEFLTGVCEALGAGRETFSMRRVLAVLRANPSLQRINQGIRRNEGLQKSLAADQALQEDQT
jgi:spore coat polysaccharide biosynthesis protein SpsF (cytidylyltransferase family)